MSHTAVSYNDEHKRIEIVLESSAVQWTRTFFLTAIDYGYDVKGNLVGVRIYDDHGRNLVK